MKLAVRGIYTNNTAILGADYSAMKQFLNIHIGNLSL